MNRKYNLRLDLQFRCNNSVMRFDEFDNDTSDFFMRITRGGELFNIDKAIVALCVIKPDGSSDAEFINIKEGKLYANLPNNLKDIPGTYKAKALLVLNDEKVVVGPIEYEVDQDNIISQVNREVQDDNRFTILTDMINRLSTVENAEELRKQAEISRAEAEKLREKAIEKIKSDATKLISDTKKEITDYKNAKDTAISEDLVKYKQYITQSIDNYKSAKDTEINNTLNKYKTNTTDDITTFKNTKNKEIDDFKNTKNTELDNYKRDKDLEINNKITSSTNTLKGDIDSYKTSKDKEIDLYKSNKDTLINNKIKEVEAAKQNIVSTANSKISEMEQAKTNMQNDVNSKIEEADNRITELQNFESQLDAIDSKNTEQDTRLKEVEYKNKVQDVKLEGLFNENNNGRLTIEGEGNSLKLEGSKEGLVTVDKVVGNTMVNLYENKSKSFHTDYIHSVNEIVDLNRFVEGREYTAIILSSTSNFNAFRISNGDIQYNLVPMTTGKIKKFTYIPPTDNINKNDIRCYYYPTDNKFIQGDEQKVKTLILEGDYTNKPIPSEYIEGMQSTFEDCLVTQEMVDEGLEDVENLGKYKYEVEVKGKNLFSPSQLKSISSQENTGINKVLIKNNSILLTGTVSTGVPYDFRPVSNVSNPTLFNYFKLLPKGTTLSLSNNLNLLNYWAIRTSEGMKYQADTYTLKGNEIEIECFVRATSGTIFNNTELKIQIEEGEISPYEPYYSKTKAVYLNSPLHKDDEIVYEDGELKYYHNVCKEVLDGSDDENWVLDGVSDTHCGFFLSRTNFNVTNYCISDKFATIPASQWKVRDREGCIDSTGSVAFLIANSRLSTLDVVGFKAWLQQNPITVVYKLTEPYKETIDTNSFLMEIPNNATISIKSVVPVQSIKTTYTANIPSVYGLQETNNNQDNLIDISLCATDEMYMMIEPILEAMPKTININKRMVSKMVDMYVAMVIRGLKTIEEVPVRYRKEVQDILNKLEK